jgi:hypothetical protein
MSDFIDKFENVLCQLKSDTETIILGDFNICMKNNNNSLGISFTNIMQLFGFEQIIKEPTRVTENCSSIIDFILCNKPENIVKSGSICVGLSDHNIIYCCRKIKRTTSGKHTNIKIRCLKKYNTASFVEELNKIDWTKCNETKPVNENWNCFRKLFTGVLDIVTSLKEIRVKQNTEPWMSTEILNLIILVHHFLSDELLLKYRKSNNSEDHKTFCIIRNKVQREVKSARSNYFSDKIEENKNDKKKLWKQLKDLGYKSKTEEASIVLNINNELCHDSKTIADFFNNCFTTVASELVKKLARAKGIYSVTSQLFLNFYKRRNPHNKNLFYNL